MSTTRNPGTGTVWLVQGYEDRAHAYPEDDSIEIAACGHKLAPETCESCGHEVHTREPNQWVPKCGACTRVLAGGAP